MADNLLDKGIEQPPPCSGELSEKYRKRAEIERFQLFNLVRVVIQHFLKTIVVQFVFKVIG